MSVMGTRCIPPLSKRGRRISILAFEQLEAARCLPYLKEGGTVVVNTQQIDPMPVVTGEKAYPQGLLIEKLEEKGVDVAGSGRSDSWRKRLAPRRRSTWCSSAPWPAAWSGEKESWLSAVERCVPQKFLEMNQKAFELGWNARAFRSFFPGKPG